LRNEWSLSGLRVVQTTSMHDIRWTITACHIESQYMTFYPIILHIACDSSLSHSVTSQHSQGITKHLTPVQLHHTVQLPSHPSSRGQAGSHYRGIGSSCERERSPPTHEKETARPCDDSAGGGGKSKILVPSLGLHSEGNMSVCACLSMFPYRYQSMLFLDHTLYATVSET
jgi:hypothetical protein